MNSLIEINRRYKTAQVGKYQYSVSESGEVFGGRFQKFLKHDTDKDGYRIATLNSVKVKVHRLVASLYCPKSQQNKNVIRHLDGNPENNHYSNLRWGDSVENWNDRKLHMRGIGENHGSAKLTEQQVREIRNFRPTQKKYLHDLVKHYGVSEILISKIRGGKIWKHLK